MYSKLIYILFINLFFISFFLAELAASEEKKESISSTKNNSESPKVQEAIKQLEKHLPPTVNLLNDTKTNKGDIEITENKNPDATSLTLPKVEIVVDSSGSMGQDFVEKKTKMFFLKKMMARFLTDQWKEKAQTGMRVYGSRIKGECKDNFLAVKFGEKSLTNVESAVGKIEPLGMTPLFKSVKMASDDLRNYEGPKNIVVFTDGEDTCGGDPCKLGAEIKNNPSLKLKIFVVAIGFKPEDDQLKKISCLGDTQVANSENELFEAMGNISQQINKDHINLKVISPDPTATVHVYNEINGQFQYFRSFTATWGATLPPGKYQAVVALNPLYKFETFNITPKNLVTLKVNGEGTVNVQFLNSILNVEILDKNKKTIKKFKSDQIVSVPTGRWSLHIYQEPFYDLFINQFDVYPSGKHEYSVVGAGAVIIKTNDLQGVYVYDSKKILLGHYLSNFPIALPSMDYTFHVNSECSFEGISILDHQLKQLECKRKAQ